MQVLSQIHPSVTSTINNYSNETLLLSLHDININAQARPLVLAILIAIPLSIIILLTILGNILVLIAICIDFALRSPTHLLMGNLACADLLLGITVLPFSSTLEVFNGRWLFGRTFCHIWLAIDVLYCTASIYGLMFISIERYFGVTCPLRYPIIITHRRTIYAILIAWFVAALISIAPFLGWHNKVKSTAQTCEVNDDLFYVLFSCSFSFYIPLVIILCVYGRIYGEATRQYQFLTGGQKQVHLKQTLGQETVTLRIHLPKKLASTAASMANGHSGRSKTCKNELATQVAATGTNKFSRMKRERKAAKTLGIVVGMFILCWSPFFLLLPIKALTSTDPGVIFSICFWLGYCNSCFNPFIYAFSSREFRKAFKSILKCERMKRHKLSLSSYRISTAARDQSCRKRSNSWGMSGSHSVLRSSSSTSTRRTLSDTQRRSRPSIAYRNSINNSHRISRQESITNTNISKSKLATNNTSPWHLRTATNVRLL
ncbi:unnamed protein product [Rotaria socialis]|uniref:G-protein coupled receptors family 1 profile domain-containing protein n=1 Tax=Rotaria socialis TaxID=392032 RepID=A0A820HQ71_9BILA|nr:unnamed protein product [Rotaria socialis]CAF3397951.1 unnamed protein product [Rotaria socialis]CAF3508371.1 unnamed protein product [Rotaria socialis]CAF3697132.1 unnamed protein product [Rotaria socialis]CAF3759505.1 unnamed protein product [Rotaria socialis]